VSETVGPMVSVVIPCLNRAHFLVPTIESVLNQDYPNIECIVVDGGSTDGTIEILHSYGERIRWVSEPDEGHADAINKGWAMAKGEILAWLNADDVWVVPDAVSKAVSYLEAHPEVDVVYGDCGSIDAEGNFICMSYLREWDLEYAVMQCDHCIPQPASFVRRRILEKVGWLDVNFIAKKDHELWLRIGLVGEIRHIPVLLAHARACPGAWARRGDITGAACVALTRKFFTLPNVPQRLRRRKRRALSNAYLRGMDYAWRDGRHRRVVWAYAARAIVTDPSNSLAALRQLARCGSAASAAKRLRLLWRLARSGMQRLAAELFPRVPNLAGDRDIEWSWVASRMPAGPGEALDFGPGGGSLGLTAAERGFNVTAVDIENIAWPYFHPRLRFVRGDILKASFPAGHFDLAINCSTVEHVGLAGRYGVTEARPNGDLEAMGRLREIMKPGAVMLLTIPVGQDAVFPPVTRIYGRERLPKLLEGYLVEEEAFWVKDGQNRWMQCDKQAALSFKPSAGSWNVLRNIYALGCFVLRRK